MLFCSCFRWSDALIFLGLDPRYFFFDFGFKCSFIFFFMFASALFYFFRKKKEFFLANLFFIPIALISLYCYPYFFGLWLCSFLYTIFILALYDAKYLFVPTWLNYLLVIEAFCGLLIDSFFIDFFSIFCEALALVGLLALLQVIIYSFLNKKALGDGDLVFVFALGIVFGFFGGLEILFLGSFIGVLFAFYKRGRKLLPMITFLGIGLCLKILLGLFNV